MLLDVVRRPITPKEDVLVPEVTITIETRFTAWA